jgi:hypothetical protein
MNAKERQAARSAATRDLETLRRYPAANGDDFVSRILDQQIADRVAAVEQDIRELDAGRLV